MSQELMLPELKDLINKEYTDANAAADSAKNHAVQCGVYLVQAKEKAGHGKWMKWCKDNLDIKTAQINNYMQLANNPETLKSYPGSNLDGLKPQLAFLRKKLAESDDESEESSSNKSEPASVLDQNQLCEDIKKRIDLDKYSPDVIEQFEEGWLSGNGLADIDELIRVSTKEQSKQSLGLLLGMITVQRLAFISQTQELAEAALPNYIKTREAELDEREAELECREQALVVQDVEVAA